MRKVWSKETVEAFMTELKRLFKENPRRSFSTASVEAMKKAAPESEWRSISSISRIGNWSNPMKIAAEAHGIFKVDTEIVKEPYELSEIPTDVLVTEALRRFSHLLAKEPDEISPGQAPVIRMQPRTVKEKRPVILIVGLQGSQMQLVQNKLAGLGLELRFAESERFREIASMSRLADATVCMTKFISHPVYNHLRIHGKQLLHCNGGLTDLVHQIKFNFCKKA